LEILLKIKENLPKVSEEEAEVEEVRKVTTLLL
jgi:hypothetical protein